MVVLEATRDLPAYIHRSNADQLSVLIVPEVAINSTQLMQHLRALLPKVCPVLSTSVSCTCDAVSKQVLDVTQSVLRTCDAVSKQVLHLTQPIHNESGCIVCCAMELHLLT